MLHNKLDPTAHVPEQREQTVDGKVLVAADLEEHAHGRDDDRADQTRDVSAGNRHFHLCFGGSRGIPNCQSDGRPLQVLSWFENLLGSVCFWTDESSCHARSRHDWRKLEQPIRARDARRQHRVRDVSHVKSAYILRFGLGWILSGAVGDIGCLLPETLRGCNG